MIFSTTICCGASSSEGSTVVQAWLNALPFAADDADALLRGVAIGGWYKSSGPVSSAASILAGGTLQPNTMGLKEGTPTKNMGFV